MYMYLLWHNIIRHSFTIVDIWLFQKRTDLIDTEIKDFQSNAIAPEFLSTVISFRHGKEGGCILVNIHSLLACNEH